MKIHEYQAKAILAEYGIPVPKGEVAHTPAEVTAIAQRVGGRVVVKARFMLVAAVRGVASSSLPPPRRRQRSGRRFSA